jgi:NADH oxidase (H2O2-forming)
LSKNTEIVIIGCGAGGGTAAQFARKTDRKSSITIFEKDNYSQYSKCGLPYAISGIIPKTSNLIEFSKEWFKNANIDLLLETTVEKIDIKNKIVHAKRGNAKIEKTFDSLIICTGAKPSYPPIENIQHDEKLANGVFVVRSIDDAVNISSNIKKGGYATIIGAGLIGLEMANSLYKKKMNITVVEALPNILQNTLDEDMSKIVYENISEKVNILTNHIANKIELKNGKINLVLIKNNETGEVKEIKTDLLIIAAGTKPEISLAKSIGCKIGKTGSIQVNEKSETSIKNIYAAGDCTEYIDIITKKSIPIGLGSIAVRQAIAAGINAGGGKYNLPKGALQTRTSEFFGLEIAAVGSSIDMLKDISIVSGKFNGSSLPDYFPGGKPISLKVIVEENSGLILSAQAVGENAALRINTFACAILGGFNVETFIRLETAYAPPIAPTLDAITLVCDIVSKKMNRKR